MESGSWDLDEQRNLFNIPAPNYPKFEAMIAKLSKRAERLIGLPIKPAVFAYHMVKHRGREIKVYEVLMNTPILKIEGWTFVACLDHSNETGTVIRTIPGAADLPAKFHGAVSTNCDHCNHNRKRRDTYVVLNDETGEYKQVGSTCLTEFFGQDPAKMAKAAEFLSFAREAAVASSDLDELEEEDVAKSTAVHDLRWIEVDEYCAATACAVRKHGWVSGKTAFEQGITPTRKVAYTYFNTYAREEITDADRDLSQRALDWARGLRDSGRELDNYENNIAVIANAVVIEPRSCGLAASIVGVFAMKEERVRRDAIKAAGPVDIAADFEAVMALFARGNSKIKYPKIRLITDDRKDVVLSLAGDRSAHKGTLNVTDGGSFDNNIWYGRIAKTGKFDKSARREAQPNMTSVVALLTALGQDPAGTAAKYGKLTGQCCFCALPLTDERSTEVGYGQKCASNWGLPWGNKRVAEAA
jgi:hypothetical protein